RGDEENACHDPILRLPGQKLEHRMPRRFREPGVVWRREGDAEEGPGHATEPVVLTEHGDGLFWRELDRREAFPPSTAPQLCPAGGAEVVHPVAVAVRRDEPPRIADADDRDRRRPEPPRGTSRNGEKVGARAGEPEAREGPDDGVDRPPPPA